MLELRGYPLFRLALLAVAMCAPSAWSQGVYSYVDGNGVRVFTNIPPKNAASLVPEGSTWPLQSREPAVMGGGSFSQPAAAGDREKLPPSRLRAAVPELDRIINRWAPVYQLDPALVKSIIAAESGFNTLAVSPKGARGLMQLMPATAIRLGVSDAFDAEENIRGGMKHLRSLLDTFQEDLVLSLAAYNAGENLVQRIGRVPAFRETHDYVRTVTARYGKTTMNKPPALSPEPPARPPMFRFLDENGVLQLTNIPPVQRQEPLPSPAGSAP